MSIYETTIKNPKKIAEFYKQLSEQKDIEIKQLKSQLEQRDNIINKARELIQPLVVNSPYSAITKELKKRILEILDNKGE